MSLFELHLVPYTKEPSWFKHLYEDAVYLHFMNLTTQTYVDLVHRWKKNSKVTLVRLTEV